MYARMPNGGTILSGKQKYPPFFVSMISNALFAWIGTSASDFGSQLHSERKYYCMQEGITYKVLLLLHNAPSRLSPLQDIPDNSSIVFWPSYAVTDHGAVKTLKSYYVSSPFDVLLKGMNSGRTTVKEVCKALYHQGCQISSKFRGSWLIGSV
jgi:hypothetical protein